MNKPCTHPTSLSGPFLALFYWTNCCTDHDEHMHNDHDNIFLSESLHVNAVDISIVAFVLLCWLLSIMLFLHWWQEVHGTLGPEREFQKEYKNIEQIQIVENHDDSVVGKRYSEEVTKNMEKREKHLIRMNSMPAILVPNDSRHDSSKEEEMIRRTRFKGSMPTLNENENNKMPKTTLTSHQNSLTVDMEEMKTDHCRVDS